MCDVHGFFPTFPLRNRPERLPLCSQYSIRDVRSSAHSPLVPEDPRDYDREKLRFHDFSLCPTVEIRLLSSQKLVDPTCIVHKNVKTLKD